MIRDLRNGKLISVCEAEIMGIILRTHGLFSTSARWHALV